MRTLHFLTFYRVLHDGSLNFLVQAICGYAPYFLLGIMAFRHRSLFALLHHVSWWQMALAAVVLIAATLAYDPLLRAAGKAPAELMRHVGEGFAGFWIVSGMLTLFSRFCNIDSRIIRFLSEASYTVYLFHFVLIAVIGYYISRIGLGPLGTYLSTIVMVYGICLLLHRYVVESGPLPRLIFNGKMMKRTSRIGVEPVLQETS